MKEQDDDSQDIFYVVQELIGRALNTRTTKTWARPIDSFIIWGQNIKRNEETKDFGPSI